MTFLLFLATFLISIPNGCAKQITSSVSCTNKQIEIILDLTSSMWTENPYLNVTTSANVSCSFHFNTSSLTVSQINITYSGGCVHFDEIYGYGEQPIAYWANTNFFAVGYQDSGQTRRTSGNYTFNAYCMVPATAHISTGKNVNGTGGHGGGGGQNYNTTDAIWMNLTDQNNKSTHAVFLGDPLRIEIVLQPKPNNVYNSLVPIYCFFSSAIDNSIAQLPFIDNNCPNYGLIDVFPYIEKIYSPDLTHYFVDFKGFLFRDAKFGTLAVTCDVLLCVNQTVCYAARKNCNPNWKSSLVETKTEISQPGSSKSKSNTAYFKVGTKSDDVLYARKSLQWNILPAVSSSTIFPDNGPTSEPSSTVNGLVCMSKQLLYFMYGALGVLGLLFFILLITVVCLLCGVGPGWRNAGERHQSHWGSQGPARESRHPPAKQYLTAETLEKWNNKVTERSDSFSSANTNSTNRLVK